MSDLKEWQVMQMLWAQWRHDSIQWMYEQAEERRIKRCRRTDTTESRAAESVRS